MRLAAVTSKAISYTLAALNRYSVVKEGANVDNANIYTYPNDGNRVSIQVKNTSGHTYAFIVTDTLYGLRDVTNSAWVWMKNI